ncbi:MAG: hypothetical protein HND55_11485 [Pseudomonadota bacterium]|nr:MAG: hypothetical protein HND55_11485 [Pseudomonadota bacterium]
MKRLTRQIMFGLVILAVSATAAAQVMLPTTTPGPHAAHISGVLGKAGKEIFGVRFIEIDGRNIFPRSEMWLKPGSYTIKVLIDAAHSRRPPQFSGHREHRRPDSYNEIELELEAGKTYEIRARYDRSDEAVPYRVILYKVTE